MTNKLLVLMFVAAVGLALGAAQGRAQGSAQGTAQGTMTFSAAEVCVYCVSPQNGHFAVLA